MDDFDEYGASSGLSMPMGLGRSSNKRQKLNHGEDNRTCVSMDSNSEDHMEDAWIPTHNIYNYSDSKSRDKMTVTVWIPSGVGEHFTYRLLDENCTLEIAVEFPTNFYNPDKLFLPIKKQLMGVHYADHVLRVAAMKKAAERMMNRKVNKMWTKTRLTLPKQCTGDMEAVLLAGKRDSHILVVDLFVLSKESLKVRSGAGLLRK